jgi:hypothetical protein
MLAPLPAKYGQRQASCPEAPERQLFVIGSERDTRRPFEQQCRFAESVRNAGHHALLLQIEGTGDDHHGLSRVALRMASQCALGKLHDEIQRSTKDKLRRP